MFKCPECNEISENNEWNKATKKEFGEEIYPIEDDGERDVCKFVCPKCSAESDGNEIEKS